MAPKIDPNPRLQSYYASPESVLGYRLLLGGTRHFGYYEPAGYNPFPIGAALRRMEDQLLSALRLPPGSRVLDAGCGDGHVARRLARRGGLHVTGIDVVERHARRARRTAAREDLAPGSLVARHMDYHHLGGGEEEEGEEEEGAGFADAAFDGVYTMETLVHAVDPDAVLAGFYRVVRPGGRIAMHEYDNVLQRRRAAGGNGGEGEGEGEGVEGKDEIGDGLRRSMAQVNEWSAMPTNAVSSPGALRRMLERAGFVDVEVRDLSAHIVPMTRFFFALAVVPFLIVSLLGLERYFINTVAGVQAYRGRRFWRYVQVSARKPGGGEE